METAEEPQTQQEYLEFIPPHRGPKCVL
jgi:hypothetical protein